MPWPNLLVLVRHAESEGNKRSREERAEYEVSTHAYDLTERGKQQAVITGEFLREKYGNFDFYYSSYYKRAKKTLKLMYPNAKRYEDPRLAEAQRGIWHTYSAKEIEKHFPLEIKRKAREGLYHHRPLGGENWPDIELRAHSFLGTLRRDHSKESGVIVVHGNWLMIFQKLVHHLPIKEIIRRYENDEVFENASVTVYEGRSTPKGSRLFLVEENVVPWKGKV